MGAILGLIFIIMVSLLAVRLGSTALMLTGLSQETAKFQACSAFFGVGFTTLEAEQVVDDPVRRRIVMWLIIAGNIGLTSALATLIVTFMSARDAESTARGAATIGVAALSLLTLALAANLKIVSGPVDTLMRWILKSVGVNQVYNYDLLLKVDEGFCVSDFDVEASHSIANKTLAQSRPSDQGIIVLNVHREDGQFIGAPDKNVQVKPGDTLMIYGHENAISEVCSLWKAEVDE